MHQRLYKIWNRIGANTNRVAPSFAMVAGHNGCDHALAQVRSFNVCVN